MTIGSVLALFLLVTVTRGTKYADNARVPVEVNTVGPYNNPTERYQYYDKLPFCKPQKPSKSHEGSALAGDRPRSSDYEIFFKQNSETPKELCTKTISQNDIKAFVDAIKADYTFDFFMDGLLADGFVGERVHEKQDFHDHSHDETAYYVFTHWNFNIHYNGPHIISVHLQTDRTKRLLLEFGEDLTTTFTYSVTWKENTNVRYEDRLKYHQISLIRQQSVEIHWLSIINSFVLVILLVAFLSLILARIVHKDFVRYASIEEDELDDIDDSGWKQCHGDVFRPPPFPMIYSALVGTGTQILAMVIGILLLSLAGTFYPGNRGAVMTAAILLYAFTSGVAGHVSSTMYAQLGGKSWATNALLTTAVFFGPFFFIFMCLNTIALVYRSTAALPWSTIALVAVIWAFVTFPLTILSAHRARHPPKLELPCKVNFAAREIPDPPVYRTAAVQIICAGVLPFTAIYIELHYIFAAVFGHRVYTLYGILCLAFLMLVIVSATITISLTYFQLVAEDWRWWWRSFFSAGSTGGYMFAYALFYFNYRSELSGFLQGSFFFGYSLLVSYAFMLMLGAIGYWSTFAFIRHIYSRVKID